MTNSNCSLKIDKLTNTKRYKHLSQCDRRRLSQWQKQNYSQKEIAGLLRVHPSTVSREIKRGRAASKTQQYSWRKSHSQKVKRRWVANQQHRRLKRLSDQEQQIKDHLRKKWSPEQMVAAGVISVFSQYRLSLVCQS